MTIVTRLGRLESQIASAGLGFLLAAVEQLTSDCAAVIVGKIRRLSDYSSRFSKAGGGLVRLDPVDLLVLQRAARIGTKALCRYGRRLRDRDPRHVKSIIASLKKGKQRLVAKLEKIRKRLHRRLARRDPAWKERAYGEWQDSSARLQAGLRGRSEIMSKSSPRHLRSA